MSNFKRNESKTVSALLNLAASRLGTAPDKLAESIRSGRIDQAAAALPPDQQQKLSAALADPKSAEKILASPQARAIMEKLSAPKK